jgi:hypothetical protein
MRQGGLNHREPLLVVILTILLLFCVILCQSTVMSSSNDSNRNDEAFNEYLRWARENGASFSIALRNTASDAGVIAVLDRDSSSGSVQDEGKLVSIPSTICMSIRSALSGKQSVLAKWLAKYETTLDTPPAQQLSGMQMLCLHLLSEMRHGKDSFYHSFIQCMPHAADVVPLIFPTEHEVKLIEDTTLTSAFPQYTRLYATSQQEFFQLSTSDILTHENVSELLSSPSGVQSSSQSVVPVTFDEFLWAKSIIATRGFRHPSSGYTFLPPIIDMMNHDNTGITTLHIHDTASDSNSHSGADDLLPDFLFEVETAADSTLSAGQEITISYGPYSDYQLLSGYGFVLPGDTNMYRNHKFSVSSKPDVITDEEWAFLAEKGALQIVVTPDGAISTQAIAMLRFILTSPANRQQVFPSKDTSSIYTALLMQPITVSHEAGVLSYLKRLISARKSDFPQCDVEQVEALAPAHSKLVTMAKQQNMHNAMLTNAIRTIKTMQRELQQLSSADNFVSQQKALKVWWLTQLKHRRSIMYKDPTPTQKPPDSKKDEL